MVETIRRFSVPEVLRPICLGLCVQFAAAFPAVVRSEETTARVTSPKDFFGFNMGDDYCLANYRQLARYWSRLEKESPRLRSFPWALPRKAARN